MRAQLLELICCPACAAPLQLETADEAHDEIWQGTLHCTGCAARYPVEQGMPHLYVDDARWRPKAREAAGWVAQHRQQGIYGPQGDNPVDFQIPYYGEAPWLSVARSFDRALDALALTGRETVLDLGAGRGWAAKEFARRGCRVVALDVVADKYVGLGRARALMDDAGVYFERIIGDGENLPLRDGAFDLVFCAAALHHFSDLALLCRNIARVLRPHGVLCAINEPCLSVAESERRALQRDAAVELALGINETRPHLFTYLAALHGAGLQVDALFSVEAREMDAAQRATWEEAVGIRRPRLARHTPLGYARAAVYFAARRLLALRHGNLAAARRLLATHGEQAHDVAPLVWRGGEMFLLAHK